MTGTLQYVFKLLTNKGDIMSKPIIKFIPSDIRSEDTLNNIAKGFLIAMKDILRNQKRMYLDQGNYVEAEKIETVVLPKGWKSIST